MPSTLLQQASPCARCRTSIGDHPNAAINLRFRTTYEQLGGLTLDRAGFVRCPAVGHRDRHPSAHLGRTADEGWHCFACGAGGAIYDFASALLGGPTGPALRGEAFRRARAYVTDVFGHPE